MFIPYSVEITVDYDRQLKSSHMKHCVNKGVRIILSKGGGGNPVPCQRRQIRNAEMTGVKTSKMSAVDE